MISEKNEEKGRIRNLEVIEEVNVQVLKYNLKQKNETYGIF
ncbi:hypothetical protein JOD82_003872 [Paenibacillus sp. 1182]|jgi:hypothetical protein|nr:hypothetical protein [Paenibacillus sp. 1182]